MKIVPGSKIGRVLATLWVALCIAVLVFGFVQREIHDMPVAFALLLMFLSFPLGAGAVVFVGTVMGSSGTSYIPFWSELPLWLAAVVVGYWQWFMLIPALAKRLWSRGSRAA
jgi:hypothetical protein